MIYKWGKINKWLGVVGQLWGENTTYLGGALLKKGSLGGSAVLQMVLN